MSERRRVSRRSFPREPLNVAGNHRDDARDVNRDAMRLCRHRLVSRSFESILSLSLSLVAVALGALLCAPTGDVTQYTCEILRRGDQFSAALAAHPHAQRVHLRSMCFRGGAREGGRPAARSVKFYRARNLFPGFEPSFSSPRLGSRSLMLTPLSL